MAAEHTATRDPRNVPTAWFALLERAREAGNIEREREALRELRRLGVNVEFAPSPNGVSPK
jgi:hypothetical protein